ncbi:MAG TPA: neutral zinc metallopeptidase [Acidimicrobiales bacterium]|nr:neutral zinc metallopeptidase [Acidimicrobiales bacterium]
MRWSRTGGGDIEDRRGSGMGMGVPIIGGGMGVVGLLVALVFGLLGGGGGGSTYGIPSALSPLDAPQAQSGPPADDTGAFVGFVETNVQDSWAKSFGDAGETYTRAKVVLYDSQTPTACGTGSAAAGPFYCPGDSKVYLDTSFFNELKTRFGAPGDFAQAYVIAHELGHHVQNLLGVSEKVSRQEQRDPAHANQLSVRLELQADCLAGVWGHSAKQQGILDPGDVEEGLRAAASVGDDTLQRQAGQRVNPETWTHGSSAERSKWFRTGFDSGDPNSCDTFS